MTKTQLAVAAAALILITASATVGVMLMTRTSAPQPSATAAPEASWTELGDRLQMIPGMESQELCDTQTCREGRFIATGIMLSELDKYPDGQNKTTLRVAASDYQDSYNYYMDHGCNYGLETFECITGEKLLDIRGKIIPQIAILLSWGEPLPAID